MILMCVFFLQGIDILKQNSLITTESPLRFL